MDGQIIDGFLRPYSNGTRHVRNPNSTSAVVIQSFAAMAEHTVALGHCHFGAFENKKSGDSEDMSACTVVNCEFVVRETRCWKKREVR